MTARAFTGSATRDSSRNVSVRMPFDPADAWGLRDRYHLAGTLNGHRFRTVLVNRSGSWMLSFGPKSSCSAQLVDGEQVQVEVWPEGPQADDLAPDITAALAAHPQASAKFAA